MKIKSISAHHSTPYHIALCTDPPITVEVFNELAAGSRGLTTFHFAIKDDLLLVKPPQITAEAVGKFNELLDAAEARVHKKHEPDEKRRKEFLDPISTETGLPVT